MAGAHFLEDLVIVLGVAALTTIIFQKLRQPVALGYILAGMIIGPHVPIPLVVDTSVVTSLSELGVILLLFTIGIEFSFRRIARVGGSAALTAFLEVGLMFALGWLTGHILGFSPRECLFLGGIIAISSTMLVARTFEEQRVTGAFTDLVFAILVFEDMLAIVLLAVLTGVATGAGLSASAFVEAIGKLIGFLIAMLVLGLLLVPRFMRFVATLGRAETLLIASIGVCFGMALVAQKAGFSVALGAFLGGMLVAESGKGPAVEQLIHPFRDVFAAIFFVSVGMTIDPRVIVAQWLPVVVLTVVVIVGKVAGVSVGAFLSGNDVRHSVRAGMSLAQIGEFSFIIAALGAASGATRSVLLPIAVAVSCLTALITPWLVRGSDRAASAIDSHMPSGLQTFVSFYDSWLERLRSGPAHDSRWRRARRPAALLVVDAVLLAASVIGAALAEERSVETLSQATGLAPALTRVVIIASGATLAALFLLAVVRHAYRLARLLAIDVMPEAASGKLDLGTAPRRALVLTLELAIFLVVGVPLAAIILPFVRLGGVVVMVVAAVIAYFVWRSIANLHGHVRAGSELIVETLARQSRMPTARPNLEQVEELLPGMPGLSPLRVEHDSPAIGKSLADLNLRALTGASVLAITRGGAGTVFPPPTELLRAGDVLALAGPEDAIRAAEALLKGDLPAD